MQADQLETGVDLFAQNGEKLGAIKELDGEYFKVDAPRATDYWLHCEHVSYRSEQGFVLDIDGRLVDEIKLGKAGGRTVLTSDGVDLGTVKEVLGDYFKVDVRMGQDYWLRSSAIAKQDGERVTLGVTAEEVEVQKSSEAGFTTGGGEGGAAFD